MNDEVLGNIPMEQVVINPHNENLGAPYEDVHVADGQNLNVADVHVEEVQEQLNAAMGHDAPDAAPAANTRIADVNTYVPTSQHAQSLAAGTVADQAPSEQQHSVSQNEDKYTTGNTAENFIPIPRASNSPEFVPHNANMNYNDIPSTSQEPATQISSITLEGMTEHITALQGLIGNLAANAQNVIPRLDNTNIINANCKIVDVDGSNGTRKRCFLQFQTSMIAQP